MTVMLVLLMERTYELPLEMCSGGMIYIQSIMKIVTDVQVILRFILSNLKCCNIGVTDGNIYEVRR